MRKKILSTADRVKLILAKDEPQFSILVELEKMELCHALNWYSQNQTKDDAHKYLSEYCKLNNIPVTLVQIESTVATLGFVARLLTRRAKLDENSMKWFRSRLDDMSKVTRQEPEKRTVNTPLRNKEQVKSMEDLVTKKCISELEGLIDGYITDDFKGAPNVSGVLSAYELKVDQCKVISEFFKPQRNDLHTAITGLMKDKNSPIAEGYEHYTIVQLRKLESLYDLIVNESLKFVEVAHVVRPPRKQKPKSPEQQVKKVKYLTKEDSLGLTSIDPKNIVGASSLWIYHVPSRSLTQYISDDDSGFSVKGSSILNYSEQKSRIKKLRKPEQILPQVINGGKVALRHIIDELTTKDGRVTGRINSQTIILRALI